MARSKCSNQRPDTLMQDRSPPARRNLLATHGRTIHRVTSVRTRTACNSSASPPIADIRAGIYLRSFGPLTDLQRDNSVALDSQNVVHGYRAAGEIAGH